MSKFKRLGLRLAGYVERLSRHSPTLGFLLIATAIYLGLLIRVVLGGAKLAFSKLFPKGAKRPSGRRGDKWTARLLLSELRRIEKIADEGIVQQEIGKTLKWLGGVLSGAGRVSLAAEFFTSAARYLPRFSQMWLDSMQAAGILNFMQGKMRIAVPFFAQVAETKAFLRARPGVPRNVRILADSWFAALGHVAMIDFLLKKQQLGWEDPDTVFITTRDLTSVPGKTLLLELERLGVAFGGSSAHMHAWDPLERAGLLQEFWEMDFPDGQGLCYSDAAAKIQNQWELEGRPPNFVKRDETDGALRYLRQQIGIPEGAWYACLHVRESGFHDRWNKLWEQARDADIGTYKAAMQAIVDRGGYVVRMGDPTMSHLEPMDGVIDYAHTVLKSEYADILLLSGARFFVGTNSGLSVVPGLYGIPCVLTNWVPIGLPNWFGADLMIPKLIRHGDSSELVSLEETLSSNLGYIQNPRDLPAGLEFIDNDPVELASVTGQMLDELDGHESAVRDRDLEEAYFSLALKHGSYRGSRIGTAFMREHAQLLGAVGPSALRLTTPADRQPLAVGSVRGAH